MCTIYCVDTHMYVYVYIYIYIYLFIFIHIHIHVCISLSLSIHIYIYIHMYINMYTSGWGGPGAVREDVIGEAGVPESLIIIIIISSSSSRSSSSSSSSSSRSSSSVLERRVCEARGTEVRHGAAPIRLIFKLRIVRPRIFESKFRNHCAKKLDGALRKPTSFL